MSTFVQYRSKNDGGKNPAGPDDYLEIQLFIFSLIVNKLVFHEFFAHFFIERQSDAQNTGHSVHLWACPLNVRIRLG